MRNWLKQLIRLHIITEVTEYTADEYRNRESGQRVHADFIFGRAGGRQTSVIITAAGDAVMYQECLSHLLRYAKSGMENEPEKTWHEKLAGWIKKSVSYRNDVDDGKIKYLRKTANTYIDELRKILKCGKEEYEKKPPAKYFREGINTYTRMTEKFDELCFILTGHPCSSNKQPCRSLSGDN